MLAVLTACISARQADAIVESDFVQGTSAIGGFTMPFFYYTPPGNAPGNPQPLILYMHGSGHNPDTINSPIKSRAGGAYTLAEDPAHPAILVCPKLFSGFWGDPTRQVMLFDIIEQIKAVRAVDTSRIYITGLSYGGAGTWNLIASNPNYFAAAVPIAGSITNDVRALVDDYAKVPIWVFHGDQDQTQHYENSRWAATEIRKRGYNIIHTEYLNAGHTGWTDAYNSTSLRQWLFAQVLGSPAQGVPICTIVSPVAPVAPATYILSTVSTISLSGTSAPPLGQTPATSVAWKVFNAAGAQTNSGTATGTDSWTANNLPLSVGENQIQIIASGPSWNTRTGTTTFGDTLRVVYAPPGETTVPVVAITAPTTGPTYNTAQSSFGASGTASDNALVDHVTWTNTTTGAGGSATGTKAWSITGVPLQIGANVIQVKAYDLAGNMASASITVNYSLVNQAPAVNAGTDTSIILPVSTVSLHGTMTDDGLPVGGSVTTLWTKQSGPGTVVFGTDSALNTTAVFSAAGTYILRLTATDSGPLSAFDEVSVVVGAPGSAGQLILALNCGSVTTSFTSPTDGTVYQPESVASPAFSVSGGTATPGSIPNLSNTEDDPLFGPYHYGNCIYNVPVPSSATYAVTLRFSDTATAAGVKVFDVKIEGQLVLDDYDIWVDVGYNKAVDKTFNIPVTDGTLNIQFITVTNNAKINAIVVRKPIPPATGFDAWAGTNSLAGSNALPEADPDSDGSNNLAEYFYRSLPGAPGSDEGPQFGEILIDEDRFLTIEFARNVDATDVNAVVERCSYLADDWITVGTITAGVCAGEGFVEETGTGSTRNVVFRDTLPMDADMAGFLRLRMTRD